MTSIDHVSQQSMPTHGPDGDHDWVVRANDLGDLYEVCVGCGKQSHWEPLPERLSGE